MSKLKVLLLLTLVCTALVNTACAQSNDAYKEGEHYRVLDTAIPLHDTSKIEIAEFFAYTCSHCYAFESTASTWKSNLGEEVNFVYIPAMWSAPMEVLARAYYTAETLDVMDKVHKSLFEAIHVDRKVPRNAEEIAEIFAKNGVDKDAVMKTFGSFGVTSMVKQADSRARGAGISGTPSLMINGTYMVEVVEGKINHQEMIKIASFLVDKIKAENAE